MAAEAEPEKKKLNNCKNVESDHKNCNLRMVNNNLKKSWQQRAAEASAGGSGRLHRGGNLLTEENDFRRKKPLQRGSAEL